MNLLPEQRAALVQVGEALLWAFESISKEANRQLGHSQPGMDPLLPAAAQQSLFRALTDNRVSLQALQREPAIARVEVKWLDTNTIERLYICRASSAGVLPSGLEGRLVSYRSALGRLAEIPAGEEVQIFLPRGRREAYVQDRAQVRPSRDGTEWDSLDNEFESLQWRIAIESVRRLLELEKPTASALATGINFLEEVFAEAEAKHVYLDQRRRKTIDRMVLRDQPVLDQYQGSIFRMPLDRQILLLGPPGAGKTTTLIRRLAQKRTEEALTSDEQSLLVRSGLKTEFLDDLGWVMFSPTELLKLYVREAFNREHIPARSLNLRTWDAERTALGRDTFRFLKGASSGRFTVAENEDSLLDCSSRALAALHDEFVSEVDAEVTRRCSDAVSWIEESADDVAEEVLRRIRSRGRTDTVTVDLIHALAEETEIFRTVLTQLGDQIQSQERSLANTMLGSDPTTRLRDLMEALGSRSRPEAMEETEDDETGEAFADESVGQSDPSKDRAEAGKLLVRCIRRLAEDAAEGRSRQVRGDLRTVAEWLGSRVPDRDTLKPLGERIRLRRRLRALDNAARALIFDVPSVYLKFRQRCAEEGRWYKPHIEPKSPTLSPSEADIVLLVMLRHARRAFARLGSTSWLSAVEARYLTQVFIDESTDFSAVQLACMLELSHPKLRSWFACGDFRQRITRHGISGRDEIGWIERVTGGSLDIREVKIEYRQSPRLKKLAEALDLGPASEAVDEPSEDPAPLLSEHTADGALAEWLTQRILEVERSVGRLPSIAVFVDGEHQIDPLVIAATPKLAAHNVRIVGCKDGRDVGNADEVRVFDIEHIKGLEFEAVFFIAVDTLAERMPDLFQKYLYVGVTRAATFLGLTCHGTLPPSLSAVRPLLSHATWSEG